jgi:hypothetical protein
MARFTRGRGRPGRTPLGKPSAPRPIAALLAHPSTLLARIGTQSTRQRFWHDWLAAHLPEALAAHLSGITERDGTLTLFAESSAWAARLRYGLRDLEAQIRAADSAVTTVTVRVLPRT